jgi:hypothetical protein
MVEGTQLSTLQLCVLFSWGPDREKRDLSRARVWASLGFYITIVSNFQHDQ